MAQGDCITIRQYQKCWIRATLPWTCQTCGQAISTGSWFLYFAEMFT